MGTVVGLIHSTMKYLIALAFLAVASASKVKLTSEQCDGTECPGGCCPYVGWYCCPDGMYCAATAADCPFVAKKQQLVQMAAEKQCDGTECPGGCCPYVGWYCCPDGMYCAATAADCPYAKNYLQKLASRIRHH